MYAWMLTMQKPGYTNGGMKNLLIIAFQFWILDFT